MDLEAREATAFGLQPDPVTAWKTDGLAENIRIILGQDEPLNGPSSRFVNTDKYP